MLRDLEAARDERDSLLYLYAIAEGVELGSCREASGVGGRPVRLLHHRGLALLYSEVERHLFDDAAIAQAMVTSKWLESTVAAHDAVLRTLASAGVALVPLRLGTTSEKGDVAARMDNWFHAARLNLHKVSGASEWSVTVALPTRAHAGSAHQAVENSRAVASRTGRHRADGDDVSQAVTAIHASLSGVSRTARSLPVDDVRLATTPDEVVMNGIYLVCDGAAEQFVSDVERLARRHAWGSFLTHGPRPPYSFAYIVQE